jgi:multiple sugar transport system substrate-binding protein
MVIALAPKQARTFVKGEKMASRNMWAAAASVTLVVALAGCSGGAQPAETGTADDPIELTFWGTTQGQQAQVDLWNENNPTVQVTYVEQGGDADMTTALQNATKADNAPDLFEIPRGYTVSLLVDGVTQDVSEWFNNDDGAFAEGAFDFVHVGETTVGVPYATNPTFNAVNTKTLGSYGFEAPATWDEFFEQAVPMQQAADVKSMNLPGEDTSYFRDIATQFGAEWWSADGDGWRVGWDSPESLAAGEIIQAAVDDDLASNHTYIEWDALMQFFSSGQLSQFTTSTWQLPVYEANFQNSVGDWALAPYPAESSADELVSPSYYNVFGFSPQSEHPAAAVQFARWLATDEEATGIIADPVDGASLFPVIADASSYIDSLLPANLLGAARGDAAEVVTNAVDTSAAMGEGPNQVAATEEFTDQWAKVLTKEIKMADALEHMQEWTVADLKAKNITVVE